MTEIDTTIGAVERGDHRAEHVALADVESALDGLWREANEQALASTGTPITRNTVLTLVACASDAEQAQAALDASDEVTAQHPARTIVLLPQPSDDPPRIETTATVHREGSGRAACYSEAIVVDAFGDAARHMPGVVLPLVVSGLPTFLWWLGEPPWGSVLLDALVDGADRRSSIPANSMTPIAGWAGRPSSCATSNRASPSATSTGHARPPGASWWRSSSIRPTCDPTSPASTA